MIKNLLLTALSALTAYTAHAQCMEWTDPSPPGVYLTIGDAPCTGQSYTTSYEVYKSEAYLLANVYAGDNFTFDICTGAGAGTWVPDFTIITPSGGVDAFGPGDGDGCSITWTATESGNYTIVINEAGNCGVAGDIDNGYPTITTNSGGNDCPVFLEGAESFESEDGSLPACWQTVDADGDGLNWEIITNEGFEGDNSIASFSYTQEDGALEPDNWLITPQCIPGNNDSLYYAVHTLNHNYSEEEYAVYVSTTGTNIADFTDQVFSDNLEYVNQWQARSVDLSAYAGQSIYLAFRHFGVTDLVGFVIDGVKLPGQVICSPTAVTETENPMFSIYPNPARTYIDLRSILEEDATLRIIDAIGRVVIEKNIALNAGTTRQDVSSLLPGVYTLNIRTNNGDFTQRFVKN